MVKITIVIRANLQSILLYTIKRAKILKIVSLRGDYILITAGKGSKKYGTIRSSGDIQFAFVE